MSKTNFNSGLETNTLGLVETRELDMYNKALCSENVQLINSAIYSKARAIADAYQSKRERLAEEGVYLTSSAAVSALSKVIENFGCEIEAPNVMIKQDLFTWFRKRLRRKLYQRLQANAVDRCELGKDKMLFVPDLIVKLHETSLQTAVPQGRQYVSAANRACKHAVRARGIRQVAEALELEGFFVTITKLNLPKFERDWRNFKNRIGEKLGFWVKEPHADGGTHIHFAIYVEPTKIDRFLRAVSEIFGSAPTTNIQKISRNSQALLDYLLKYFPCHNQLSSKDDRLAFRAASFRASSGNRFVGFFDCASSTSWDDLRAIKDQSNTFKALTYSDQEMWSAACNNDYARFLVISARSKCLLNEDASSFIRKISEVEIAPTDKINEHKLDHSKALVSNEKDHDNEPYATVRHRSIFINYGIPSVAVYFDRKTNKSFLWRPFDESNRFRSPAILKLNWMEPSIACFPLISIRSISSVMSVKISSCLFEGNCAPLPAVASTTERITVDLCDPSSGEIQTENENPSLISMKHLDTIDVLSNCNRSQISHRVIFNIILFTLTGLFFLFPNFDFYSQYQTLNIYLNKILIL